MAHREGVFESKVLQKLYPAALKLEKEPIPPRFVETLAKKKYVKASQEDMAAADAGKTQSAANLGRRMYTVLPPPPDYKTDLEKSVTLPQLQSVNSAEDPAASLRAGKLPLLSGVVDDLLSNIASGRKPASVVKQLSTLKAFVQQRQTDELEKALEMLYNTSSMSAEETTAVVSLFRYWITDIFPMQGDKKNRLSTGHL